MSKQRIIVLLAVCGALAAGGEPASATGVRYVGKTRSGNKITFIRNGNRVRAVTTGVFVNCLSINRVGQSQAGIDPWVMPDSFSIGRTSTVTRLMRTALYYSPVTVTAKTTLHRPSHGRIGGRLEEVFAFAIPTYPIPETIDYGCRGVTTFTAKPA